MTDHTRFTVFTVTIKFTLPKSTSDQDAQSVHDALKLWVANPDFKERIDTELSVHLADMEYVPVLPDDPFDTENLKIEVE
jgi:hypothetical protein